MRQVLLTISLVGFVFVALGCREPAERRPHAEVALDGLMPTGDLAVDWAYVADQSKVTTLPRREIPEGNLLSIAAIPQPKAEVPSMPAAAPASEAAAPAPGNADGNFWDRIGEKTLGTVLWENAAERAAAADQEDDADDDDDANLEEEETEEEDEE